MGRKKITNANTVLLKVPLLFIALPLHLCCYYWKLKHTSFLEQEESIFQWCLTAGVCRCKEEKPDFFISIFLVYYTRQLCTLHKVTGLCTNLGRQRIHTQLLRASQWVSVQCQIATKAATGKVKVREKAMKRRRKTVTLCIWTGCLHAAPQLWCREPCRLGVQSQAAPKPANTWPEGTLSKILKYWENLGRWRCHSPRQEAMCIPAFERAQRSAQVLEYSP